MINMQSYEVEIKSLLGGPERAESLRQAMKNIDSSCKLVSSNSQLNHYFQAGSLPKLITVVAPKLPEAASARLSDLAAKASDTSVRTRDKDGAVYLVVKATIGDDTSANGVARMEFEEKVLMTLAELDALVISASFEYQAKWSRIREEYVCLGTNVTLDKNAGYGWLAEFERIVDGPLQVDDARREVRTLMEKLEVEELPQGRLERMFSHYNAHWPEYYGTEKIFIVE